MNWKRGIARMYLAAWAVGFLVLITWITASNHETLSFSGIAQTLRDAWQPLFLLGVAAPGVVFLLAYWVIRGFSKTKEDKQ